MASNETNVATSTPITPDTTPKDDGPAKGSVGNKTIGKYGSFVYIINQIFGPGVLAIPIVFQQAGGVVPVLVLLIFCLISGFNATLLCESIRMIPGNANYEKRYEYTTAVRHYFGTKFYAFFQICMNMCLQSINIASIVVCAQSMDSFLVFCFKCTYALRIYPHPGFEKGDATSIANWYGAAGEFEISLGYIIIMVLCIPMGMVNLDENIKFQWISFFGLVVLMGDFIVYFLFESPFYWASVPVFGDQYSQVVSVCIFSWAFIMLVPSWANEKKPHVSINKTIWSAAIASTIGYTAIGVLSALSFQELASDDVLKRMQLPGNFILTRISAYLFSLFIIAPGIPVFCISTRYNLYLGGICGRRMAFFLGVIAPWLVSWIFAQGPRFATFLNWTSLVFSGFVNFIMPLVLYIAACRALAKDKARAVQSLNSPEEDSVSEPFLSSVSRFEPLAFPRRLQAHGKKIAVVLLGISTILILAQIVVDLYYLIALHKNLLDS